MLTKFDWFRRCRTGTELLATLKYFSNNPNFDLTKLNFGAPFSATGKLCQRCRIYAPVRTSRKYHRFCFLCNEILTLKNRVKSQSHNAVIVWGYVNQISRRLQEKNPSNFFYGIYLHENQRFLAAMHRQHLREWLQDLVLYSGTKLKGLIQIFSSLGIHRNLNMGDYLSWAVHHEANLSMNELWIRFYTEPHQIINPKIRDQLGLLTYNISEFISMLEMVEVFRAKLRPDEQEQLYELLLLENPTEEHFFWGRFLGELSQGAKDMLSAWNIRKWEKKQVNFFYNLIKYVILPQSN